MQALRYLMGLLAVVTILMIAGCNGPAPGLDPIINLNQFSSGLPYLAANRQMSIDGELRVNDANNNPVTSIRWTQAPAIGTFASPTTLATAWRVRPELIDTITEPTDVTLTVTVETLQGGRRVVPVNLIIMPLSVNEPDDEPSDE